MRTHRPSGSASPGRRGRNARRLPAWRGTESEAPMWRNSWRRARTERDMGWAAPLPSPERGPCDPPIARWKRPSRGPGRGRGSGTTGSASVGLPAGRLGETPLVLAVGEAIVPAVTRGIDAEGAQARGVLVAEDDPVQRHRLRRELHAAHAILAAVTPARAGEALPAFVATRHVVL